MVESRSPSNNAKNKRASARYVLFRFLIFREQETYQTRLQYLTRLLIVPCPRMMYDFYLNRNSAGINEIAPPLPSFFNVGRFQGGCSAPRERSACLLLISHCSNSRHLFVFGTPAGGKKSPENRILIKIVIALRYSGPPHTKTKQKSKLCFSLMDYFIGKYQCTGGKGQSCWSETETFAVITQSL